MRFPRWISLGALLVATGCATYKQDLARAQAHYETQQFERALALLRVLEPDVDSLEPGQRTRYAYVRGMTDYRLASLTPAGDGATHPRESFRSHARHWLSLAAAMEKQTPGGVSGDERKRLDDALADLNAEVYGGADAPADRPGAPAAAPGH
jgi:hypothetical protein